MNEERFTVGHVNRIYITLALALAVLGVHTLLVWGYTGQFWGDIGRWSHEVERFAHGELPYRDFQWHYPPLGIWVEGLAARLIGTDRTPLSIIATSLSVVIVVGYVYYARRVLRANDAVIAMSSVLLALAFVQSNGAPLPLGMYSPAAIVGAAPLAWALVLFTRQLDEPNESTRQSYLMAALLACAVLSKQDFWAPAAYVMVVHLLRTRRLGPSLLAAVVFAAGLSVVVATTGMQTLTAMFGGFGHVRMAGGQGFPSWERITIDVLALSLVCAIALLLAAVARRRLAVAPLMAALLVAAIASTVHIVATLHITPALPNELPTDTQRLVAEGARIGAAPLHSALKWLLERVGQTPLPVALAPFLLVVIAVRWRGLPAPRREVVAVLLGLCIALRLRRAFEATEWFEFLFSLPIYLAAAELLLALDAKSLQRFRVGVGLTLAAFALVANAEYGRGYGTRRVYAESFASPRGIVHWAPGQAAELGRIRAAIDSIDPSGQRPLFAFGFSGGWNYFLGRRNPFPFTQDFFFSAFNADSVLQHRPAKLFLIDDTSLRGSYGAARFDWRRWDQPRVEAPYAPYDHPRFNRLREGCTEVPKVRTRFHLYACP